MYTNNFDKLSPVYDLLAKIVFGKSILESQNVFLSHIMSHSRILIIGGGSGKILDQLSRLNIAVEVDYIELSKRMQLRSQKRVLSEKVKVNFIHADLLDHQLGHLAYDVVITYFFLDVFNYQNLEIALSKIAKSLKPSGLWLVTDFRQDKALHNRLLLRIMFLFFRITANLEASSLLNFDKHIRQLDWTKKHSRLYYYKMIEACIYKKR